MSSEGNNESHAPVHSRRKILRGAAGLAIGMGTGVVGGGAVIAGGSKVRSEIESMHQDSGVKVELVANPNYARRVERQELLTEIADYRSSLGLSPTPPELAGKLDDMTTEWLVPEREFQNELPEYLQSYGDENRRVQDIALGENAGRLVKRIVVDQTRPNALYFSGINGDRKCIVGPWLNQEPIDGYIDAVLHEAVGHGTDPAPTLGTSIYPADVLFKVSHGKWRMLSQAFEIKGQFLNHPKDLMLPQMQKDIGRNIAQGFVNNNVEGLLADGGIDVITGIVQEIAQREGKAPKDLKFNKRRSQEIGTKILEMQRQGNVHFSKKTQDWYDMSVEQSLREIYAEMMRMAILRPDEIGSNPEIMSGCEEVLSAVQGKSVDLRDVHDAVALKDPAISAKNMQEQLALGMEVQGPMQFPLVMKPLNVPENTAKQQYNGYVQENNAFNTFVDMVQLPGNVDPDSEVATAAKTFAYFLNEINKKYNIKNVVGHLDMTFDPEMHIWDIDTVERSFDATYARDLVQKLRANPDSVDLKDLRNRNKILGDFFFSPVFGT